MIDNSNRTYGQESICARLSDSWIRILLPAYFTIPEHPHRKDNPGMALPARYRRHCLLPSQRENTRKESRGEITTAS